MRPSLLRDYFRQRTTREVLPIRAVLIGFVLAFSLGLTFTATPAVAVTTTPQKINFQGRLTDASGNLVANGLYNMKFALYDAASGGTLKWNETRETTNRVQVTSGLFTVQLGSVSAFTNPTIFSAGNLYFEITLANPATATCSTASCQTWEAAMSRSQLATSAYAFNSELLDGIDSSGFVKNQNSAQQATANFWMSGTGRADTALQAPALDTATSVALTIGGTNASSVTIGRSSLAGTITLGNSTATNIISIGAAAGGAATQTINIGTSATASSTTNVTIGSTIAGTTILQGSVRVSALTTNGFVKTSGANGALSVASTIALGSEVSGTLGIGNGGTNNTTYTTNGVNYYDGTKIASTAAGTTGQCIAATTGSAPVWGSCGVLSTGAISATPTANGATITGTTLSLTIADGTNGGVLNASTQTIGGDKTFKSAGFQVQNASSVALFTVDSSTARLYIGPTAGDTVGTLLVLGNKTNAGDPTGVDGGMYYNSSLGLFRCYENGSWRNCTGALDTSRTTGTEEFIVSGASDLCPTILTTWTCVTDGTTNRAMRLTDETNHPGMFSMSAGSATTSWVGMLSSSKPLSVAYIDRTIFYVKTDSNLANLSGFRVGLVDSTYSSVSYNSLTGGYYFEYNGGSVWKVTTRKNATPTETITATSAGIAASTWYKLELRKTVNGFDFYINDTNVGSSNPANASAVTTQKQAFMLKNGTSVQGKLIIDYAGYEMEVPGR